MRAGATIRATATTSVATASVMTSSTAPLIATLRLIKNEVETTRGDLRADRDPTIEDAIHARRSRVTSIYRAAKSANACTMHAVENTR